MKRLKAAVMLVLLTLAVPASAWARAPVYDYIPLIAPAAVLMETSTSQVLFGKNEHQRMYPASMTKILTAITALDYLNPDDILVVGKEIYQVPADYNTAIHVEGESATVRNLLRALMIRSGNETGNILALNAIRARDGVSNIPYDEAKDAFCDLMNEKAQSLGALDTHFDNTYGLQSEEHYTTAYDLALISAAFMSIPELKQIAGEREYVGDSLEGRAVEGALVSQYSFPGHNLMILPGDHYYPYATGIKTGFTDEAGDCVTASAEMNGVELVAVVFNSPEPGRWQDARLLMDYGFAEWGFATIHEADEVLEVMQVANPRLGETDTLEILACEDAVRYMRNDDAERLRREVVIDRKWRAPSDQDMLLGPIEQDEVVGTVAYRLGNETVFEGEVRVATATLARDSKSDMDYYIQEFKDTIFTMKGLPYWVGGVGVLIGVVGVAAAVAGRRNRRRDSWRGGYGRIR